MSMSLTIALNVKMTEREARSIVRDWIEEWGKEHAEDRRWGITGVSTAAAQLREALDAFENANSGDNGK